MSVRDWLKRIGSVLVEYVELVVAGIAGVVVGVLGEAGDIHGDHLTEATLVILGVLAFGVVKERYQRHRLTETVNAGVSLIAATKPWQVLYEDMKWDLETSHGARATATAVKELLFTRDEVLSIYEYQYDSPGRDADRTYRGGIKSGPLQDLPMMREGFPGTDGKFYRLISLERVCRVGEIMRIESERKLEDRFPGPRENVSKEIAFPTTRLSLEVVWPPGTKPTAVWIERTGQPQRMVNPSRPRLTRHGRRWFYKEDFAIPKPGERIALWWDW